MFRKNDVCTHPAVALPWPVQCAVHDLFSVVDLRPGTESRVDECKGYTLHVSAWLGSR